jgi:lantibiotic modifying enzyme
MHPDDRARLQAECTDAGLEALRWVAGRAVPAEGGVTWPDMTMPGSPRGDDLYEGTASVLAALAQARLCGHIEYDEVARSAASRLITLISDPAASGETGPDGSGEPDLGLYTGICGMAAALRMWYLASGDRQALNSAQAIVRAVAGQVTNAAAHGRPVTRWRDIIEGEAGILLVLLRVGEPDDAAPAASTVADQLIDQVTWIDGLPDWYPHADHPQFLPNFSHGLAGIGFALAAAARPLGRPDLLNLAQMAGRRLVKLGQRPDGTLAVPHSLPPADPEVTVTYGWCHGPVGTLRLFELLNGLCPGQGWDRHAGAARQAVRRSGLPARLYPGFWDNLGQCCGTAGVGEMALDRYQRAGDPSWLAWAGELAADVLARRTADASGVRWSNTEHRASPPELEPAVGFMQGAAGIAAWLLRLAAVIGDGSRVPVPWWPDRP